MTDNDSEREETDSESGPVGTMLGATFGPFGAAMGSVVDENRFAFRFAFGTGASSDDGMRDATAIEIEGDDEGADAAENESKSEAEESEVSEAEASEAEGTADESAE